jgi:hypothetical protein
VKAKGAHQQEFASTRNAGNFSMLGNEPFDFGRCQNPCAVCGGRNAERAVGCVAIVQMEADGEKAIQNKFGWSREVDALFDGWEIESSRGDPFCEWKHEILMPGDLPVGRGGFVECNRLDGDRIRREMARLDQLVFEDECSFPDVRFIQQAAFACIFRRKQRVGKFVLVRPV